MDRAMQLDSLLRSMEKYYKNYNDDKIIIVYKYTNEQYKKGYEKVMNTYPNYYYFQETDIKQNMLDIFEDNKEQKYSVFFSDDNLWKDDFDSKTNVNFQAFEFDEQILCYTLRLHPRIKKCYPMGNIDTPPPKFNDEPYIWNWQGLSGDWGYPCSIDGHIFRTGIVHSMIKLLPYKNVNQIEAFMSMQHNILKNHYPKMVCSNKSAIMNLPWNRVQTNSPNINMDIDLNMLNEKYINGEIIDLDFYKGFDTISPHQEVEIKFTKE